MQLNLFDFNLPKKLIAQYPLPKRSASRLMCLDKHTGKVTHRKFVEILDLLSPNDLLVFNDTKVIPARVLARKKTGGNVEILVERILGTQKILAQLGANKRIKIGTELQLADDLQVTVTAKSDQFFELVLNHTESFLEVIKRQGHMPLPPYIERKDTDLDQERYQTVFAARDGAVAAPTAGLHFDHELLAKIHERKVDTALITLHVGAGTFQPVRVDEITQHQMHAEYVEITPEVCDKINAAREQGKRIVAVGTTCVRALETAVSNGALAPWCGDTKIFIYPGYQFRCVDALLTNFHLPKSTLLMLVCALAGRESVMRAYHEAIAQQYRFFSYGDAMMIV